MKYINPEGLFKPANTNLNWAVKSSPTETLHVSGLVALAEDGSVPADEASQVAMIFDYLQRVLSDAEMDVSHLVKLTSFFVTDEAYQEFGRQRPEFLGDADAPASTGVFVSKLVHPDLKIEIEAIAVKET